MSVVKKASSLKFVRKFTFSDQRLAYKVRGNMLDILTKFDENKNKLFDEE
jgi:hypothetical protein